MADHNLMNYPALDREFVTLFGSEGATGTPERRLVLAILERAILDYVGNDTREVQEAETWLFGDDDDEEANTDDVFSFSWVCDQLDLEPRRIARLIKAMPRRGNRRIAPWYFNKTYGVGVAS